MIYIAGKVSGTTDYDERFAAAEERLTNAGYIVINPVKYSKNLPASVSYSTILNVCLVLLDECDAIYLLKDWEESTGANLEYSYAMAKSKLILYEESNEGSIKDKEEPKSYKRKLSDDFNILATWYRPSISLFLCFNEEEDAVVMSSNPKESYITEFTDEEYEKLSEKFEFPKEMFEKIEDED